MRRYEEGLTSAAVAALRVMCIFAVTKFHDGAWIVVFLIPAIVFAFSSIHRHYKRLAKQLSRDQYDTPSRVGRHRVILPIAGVHRGSLAALAYARALT